MRKLFFAVLLSFIIASCYHTTKDPTFDMSKVLPADTMVTLLADLHIVDGIIDNMKDENLQSGHLSSEYFNAVLKMHNLDKTVFEESMSYYAFHTEELDKIYEKVIINLSKRESMMITPKEAEEKLP